MSDQTLHDPQNPSGPAQVRNLVVQVVRDLCIGAATCVAIAPMTFVMDSEAKAIILKSADQDSDESIIDAARGCPTAAITVRDTVKNVQVFPN